MSDQAKDIELIKKYTAGQGLSDTQVGEIYSQIEKLMAGLIASEKLAVDALQNIDAKKSVMADHPDGYLEFGGVLQALRQDVNFLEKAIDNKDFTWVAQYLQSKIPPSEIPQDVQIKLMNRDGIVAEDGTIFGFEQYEQLDPGWLFSLAGYIENILDPGSVAKFGTTPYEHDLVPGTDGKVQILVIGDWGTGHFDEAKGYDPAAEVMAMVEKHQPDYLIHLGDVYYAGTDKREPPNEEHDNFLALWPEMKPEHSFTLNSNHEMYGAAQGYFKVALGREHQGKPPVKTPFSHQNGTSYFALTLGKTVIVGLDAAYHDTSFMYMKGGLGDAVKHPHQYDFLKRVTKGMDRVILMSHQTGTDYTGEKANPLWDDVSNIVTPDYWYWGHEHLGVAYNAKTVMGPKVKARCVGHSSIPFGEAWGLECADAVNWYEKCPLNTDPDNIFVRNGFMMLSIDEAGVDEFFYEVRNNEPVWINVKSKAYW